MELQGWKEKFAPTTLKRGRSYFRNIGIHSLECGNEKIHAVASGGSNYNVDIYVDNNIVSYMSCTCLFARKDNCKHMAAVLFAASDDEYREAAQNVSSQRSLLESKIPNLLSCKCYIDAFTLPQQVFMEMSEAGFDSSREPFASLYEECEKHWRTILPYMDKTERLQVFDWFFANYGRWRVSKRVIESFLFGSSSQEPAFLEPECLYRVLDLLDIAIQKPSMYQEDWNGWLKPDLNYLVKLRLDMMKRIPVEQTEIARYMEEHYWVYSIREQLIEAAIKEGRCNDAIMILRKVKAHDIGDCSYLRADSEKLMELYQTLGLTDELKSEILYHLDHFSQGDLRYVNVLKGITPAQDWPEMMDHILVLRGMSHDICGDLMKQEQQYQRLLEYVIESRDASLMDRYIGTLSQLYPKEVKRFYVVCLRAGMAHAYKRSHYSEQVKHLKVLSQMQGGKRVAAALAKEWRTTWPRRRAMLEILQKYGF